jgi:4-diphosphocytidyl-2-C-methyl-D-erythritol kinase
MLTFPNAKINLGLNIVSKRADGYHNLETVFYPIPLRDALEVTPLPDGEKTRIHLYGETLEGNPDDNLVVRAYRLLAADFALPPVDIRLYKQIPSGAGLGGGSADATFMLKLLNEQFSLGQDNEALERYAALLGADCPFFVSNLPVYAEGTGNLFSPLSVTLKGYQVVVVKPNVFVSTREAFAHITPRQPEVPLKEVISRPITTWRGALVNDFEEGVIAHHPIIGSIKEELYRQGAIYASMSGSGSAVFGIFPAETSCKLCSTDDLSLHILQII